METCLWLIFLLLSGPIVGAQKANYACENGCILETSLICGQDGAWYQNECVAYCAGISVDADNSSCKDTPMPFDNAKPGPTGAESDGVTIRTVAKEIINAFRAEGLHYVGRIKLARDLGQRAQAGVAQPEPDTEADGNGNWKVDAVRCTSAGDVYRGTMTIPTAAMDLAAAAPRPLAPWFNKNALSGLAEAGDKLMQESGSYAQESGNSQQSSNSQQQEQSVQQQRPLSHFLGSIRDALSSIPAMFRRSGGQPGNGAAAATDLQGDNHVLEAAATEGGQEQQQAVQQKPPQQPAAAGEAHTYHMTSSSSEKQSEPDAGFGQMQEDLQLLNNLLAETDSTNGTESLGDKRRRLLEIIGADNRFSCKRGYPYSAVGQIQVVDNTGLYICTGTLIKPDKVLTAAHCVWNTKRNAFYYNLNFAPGRYRDGGNMVNPWGVVPWSSVTVFDAFKKNPAKWDVAVVTLSKKLGSLTGYMGMAAGCSSNLDLTIAGYPQDQAQGTCMADTCKVGYLDCNALTNIHTCDTLMGMSGSPLWDNKNRIRMIHVAGIAGKPENRATTVTQFLINTISKW